LSAPGFKVQNYNNNWVQWTHLYQVCLVFKTKWKWNEVISVSLQHRQAGEKRDRLVQLCKDWRLLVELYLMEPAQVEHQLLLDPLLHSCLQYTFKVHIHSYIHIHIHVCMYIYIYRYMYIKIHSKYRADDKSWAKLFFFSLHV
jgi:hypothetical protein